MLAIGRSHLDWGSADQPPLAPALAALTDAVAPGSLIALRVPVVLAVAVAAVGPLELAVLGRDLAAVAHLDGVLKPLRRVNRAGRTGSSFQLRAEGVSDGSVVTRGA